MIPEVARICSIGALLAPQLQLCLGGGEGASCFHFGGLVENSISRPPQTQKAFSLLSQAPAREEGHLASALVTDFMFALNPLENVNSSFHPVVDVIAVAWLIL